MSISPGDVALEPTGAVVGSRVSRGGSWTQTLRAALRLGRTRIGLGIVAFMVLLALAGPAVAPHSPTAFVAAPNAGPRAGLLLGADGLGRDVLSRFLDGGRTVIGLAFASGLLGVGLGVVVGLVAAYARNWLDDVLMRGNDVLLAFPQIILVLLALATLGPKLWLIVVAVGITHAPRTARVIRGAAVLTVGTNLITDGIARAAIRIDRGSQP